MRVLAIAVLAATGCGAAADLLNGQGNCTAAVTGAVALPNVSCIASAGTDSNGSGNGAVAFNFTNPSGYQLVVGVGFSGAPAVKTYSNTDSGAKSGVEVIQNGSAQTWAALAGQPGANQGSYTLSITSLGSQVNNPDGGPGSVFLTVHGTLNATLPAITGTGASGTATMTATF
ncbi:MAG TPA: hypothetical protein VFE90_02635 [Myxococcales bacterium]|jgi:hypothetical protein|nr:hypothetical protein [Myxococcales bacterium]